MNFTKISRKGAALLLAAGIVFSPVSAYAANTYYEVTKSQTITKGVTYETSKQVTDAGLLDIYVLKIPLNDPNLKVTTMNSNTEYGLKETTAKILADNNAIAGVNGDFFGMAGTYSIPLGFESIDGYISADKNQNAAATEAASLVLSEDSALIDYVKTSIAFRNNGSIDLGVNYVNKITNLAVPSFVTYGYMKDTASLDARVANAYKLVVENGIITYISLKGETVKVPQNGFLVVMNEADFEHCKGFFAVGQTAEMLVDSSIDLNKLNTAITGSLKILHNGQIAENSGTNTTGRAPRTAVGLSEDKSTLILMAIDGRTHSIGASQKETAQLMQKYGAYNAMYLDGGGSTTMAVQLPGKDALEVVNTLSDGAQRKVINTLGVVNNAQIGAISSIKITAQNTNSPKGIPNKITVAGYDEYMHKIDVPLDGVTFTAEGGTYSNAAFTPDIAGEITINAEFMGMTASTTFKAIQVAEIRPSVAKVTTSENGTQTLSFKGASRDGYSLTIDPSMLGYEVYPADLGTMVNGTFTAAKAGNGWIRSYLGDANSYIPVSTSISLKPFDSLDGLAPIQFSSYPATVTGTAVYSSAVVNEGKQAAELKYNLLQSTETQAAYMDFTNSNALKTYALGYKISVYGDNSGHWLRGRITDANGKNYTIDFTKNINFTGWQDFEAKTPDGVAYPIVLDRIYVASLSEAAASSHTIYVDNLRILANTNESQVEIPGSTTATDSLYSKSLGDKAKGEYDMTFMGGLSYTSKTAPSDYGVSRKTATAAAAKGSVAVVYGGSVDISPETGVTTHLHNGSYKAYGLNDMVVIKMFAGKGGFAATDASQWSKVKNDIAASYSSQIVIHTDTSPLDFQYTQEYNMFHDILKEAAKNGKNIFVVSNSGTNTTNVTKDGVRYINLGALYDGSTINKQFSILRFRINGDTVKYSLEKVFS